MNQLTDVNRREHAECLRAASERLQQARRTQDPDHLNATTNALIALCEAVSVLLVPLVETPEPTSGQETGQLPLFPDIIV